MPSTSSKTRGGILSAKKVVATNQLILPDGGALTATAAQLNAAGAKGNTQGGQVSITGTGTVTATLATITSVVATLAANASLNANEVTVSVSGLVITLKAWKPTSNADPTPIASTTATAVNWLATGT